NEIPRARARRSPASRRWASSPTAPVWPARVAPGSLIAGAIIAGQYDAPAMPQPPPDTTMSEPPARPSSVPSAHLRGAPPPRAGGPLRMLRFMRENNMLSAAYARMFVRLGWLKLRHRGRLRTDGPCFICPGVQLEIGSRAVLEIGRWAWIGH